MKKKTRETGSAPQRELQRNRHQEFQDRIIKAFIFFGAVERGISEQVMIQLFSVQGASPEETLQTLTLMVETGRLRVSQHEVHGNIYYPTDQTKPEFN